MENFFTKELGKIDGNKFNYYRMAAILSFILSSSYSSYVGDNNLGIVLSYISACTLIRGFDYMKVHYVDKKLHNLYN